MAEHRISLLEAVGPSGAGGPIYPGEDVAVKVRVLTIATGKVKSARFEVSSPGWSTPKALEAKDTVTVTRSFTRDGQHTVRLTSKRNCEVGAPAELTVEVKPFPSLRVEVPRGAELRDRPGEYPCGPMDLRVNLDQDAPHGGAEAELVSKAFEGGKVKVTIAAGMRDGVARPKLVYDGYAHPVEVRPLRRCQAATGAPVQLKPGLPRATLAWADPDGAKRTYSGDGDDPTLVVELDHAAHEELKLYVEGAPVKQRGGMSRGKERSVLFTFAPGATTVRQVVGLDAAVRAGRHELRLTTHHQDKGAQPVHGQNVVRVELAPKPRLSLPERWLSPDKPAYHVGDTVDVTVALDARAPEAGTLGELRVTAKGAAARTFSITVEKDTQEARVQGVALEVHDLKTTFEVVPDTTRAAHGDKVERTLKVHQVNKVYLRKVQEKEPFFPGGEAHVVVRLKYPLDAPQGGGDVVATLRGEPPEVLEPTTPIEVRFEHGTDQVIVPITFGGVPEGTRSELVLEVAKDPTTGQAKAAYRLGEDSKQPARLAVDLRPQRELTFSELTKPHLLGHPDVTQQPFYVGEEVVVTMTLSAPIGAAFAPDQSGSGGMTIGTLKIDRGKQRRAKPNQPAPQDPKIVVTDKDATEVTVQVPLPAAHASTTTGRARSKVRLVPEIAQGSAHLFAAGAKKKGLGKRQAVPLTLKVVPLPQLVVAEQPWKVPPGGVAPTVGSDGAWPVTKGERRTLVLQPAGNARVPLGGLHAKLTLRKGQSSVVTTPQKTLVPVVDTSGVDPVLTFGEQVGKPPPGSTTTAHHVELTFDDWKKGLTTRDVVVVLNLNATAQPGIDPVTQRPVQEVIQDELVVATVKPGARKTAQQEVVVPLRVDTTAEVSFAAEEDWFHAAGQPRTGRLALLHPGDRATVHLHKKGARPTPPTGSTPGSSAPPLRLLFTSLPPATVVPLAPGTPPPTTTAPTDKQTGGGQDTEAPVEGALPFDDVAGGYWLEFPVETTWPGAPWSFDVHVVKRATQVSIAAAPPAPPHGTGQAPPPSAPRWSFKVEDGTRAPPIGVGRTVQLAAFDLTGQPLVVPTERSVYPDEQLRFKLVVDDDVQPGDQVARLESTAFGPRLLMPFERDDMGRVVKELGRPRRIKQTEDNKHLGTPQTDPLTGETLPGFVNVVVPERGQVTHDLSQPDAYDEATRTFTLTVTIAKKPIVPAGAEGDEVVHEFTLVDQLKSLFTPGAKAKATARVRPLPLVRFAAVQPNLPEGPPAAPPPSQPGQPPGAPRRVFQTVAMASHEVLVEVLEPPPPGGATLLLHATCFPVDEGEKEKLQSKAEDLVKERAAAAWALRQPFHYRQQLDAALYAAEQAARLHKLDLTPEDFLQARSGVLTKPVPVLFQEAVPQHAMHVVATITARNALVPRTDGMIAYVWGYQLPPEPPPVQPGDPPSTEPVQGPPVQGAYFQWRPKTPTSTATTDWFGPADLDDLKAYRPKTRPPVVLTLKAKAGARTEPPLGESVDVRVAARSVSFPPGQAWWVRPKDWPLDDDQLTDAQRELVRARPMYAAGDVVVFRVFRTPLGGGDDPIDLDALTPDERDALYPEFPDPDPARPRDRTLFLSSTAFQPPELATPSTGQRHDASFKAPVRHPIRFRKGEAYSEPIEATIKGISRVAPADPLAQLGLTAPLPLPMQQQLARRVDDQTFGLGAVGAVTITGPGVPAAKASPGAKPVTPPGPPTVLVIEPAAEIAPHLAQLLALTNEPTPGAVWEEDTGPPPTPPAQAPLPGLRIRREATLPGAIAADVRVVIVKSTAEVATALARAKPPPQPTGSAPVTPPPAPVVIVVSDAPPTTTVKPTAGAAFVCVKPGTGGPDDDRDWEVLAREVLLYANVASRYKPAPGAVRQVSVLKERRAYFSDYVNTRKKERLKTKHLPLVGDDAKREVATPKLEAVIDDELTLSITCNPPALVRETVHVNSPLLGWENGAQRSVEVVFEPGEWRRAARLKLVVPPPTPQDSRIFLAAGGALLVGRPPKVRRKDQHVSKKRTTPRTPKPPPPPLESLGLRVKLRIPEVRIRGLLCERERPDLLDRFRALFRKQDVTQVVGQGEKIELQVELSLPAREGTTLIIHSEAFGVGQPVGGVKGSAYVVTVPAGETRASYALEIGGGPTTHPTALDVPHVIEVIPGGNYFLCKPDPEGRNKMTVVVASLPVVGFPWLDHEDLGLARLFGEDGDQPGGVPTEVLSSEARRERHRYGGTPVSWTEPEPPFAVGDTVRVRVRLTKPLVDGVARVDLRSDAFDRTYPIELQPDEQEQTVDVVMEKAPGGRGEAELRLEAAEGCLVGVQGRRWVKLYERRVVYFPPRHCLAPTGPFVKGDRATLTLRLFPPAPPGGAAVDLDGPIEPIAVEFAEGESVKAAMVRFATEADSPQAVTIKPRKGCAVGEHAQLTLQVKTPTVELAKTPVQPIDRIQVNQQVHVSLVLSHPAPDERPFDPDDPSPQPPQDGQGGKKKGKKGGDDKKDFAGTTVKVTCAKFEPPEQVVHFLPGQDVATAAFRIRADAAKLDPQDPAENEAEVVVEPVRRCKAGQRTSARVMVRPAPTVRFAGHWIEPGAPTPLDPEAPEPGLKDPPGQVQKNAQGELVFKVGDAANIYLEASEEPHGDVQVMLKSPAFGPTVYLVRMPKAPKGKLDKVKGKRLKPFALRVTFARGLVPGGDGITPEQRFPVQLFPAPGWQVDPNEATREVYVRQEGTTQPCPLGNGDGTTRAPAPTPPLPPVSFDQPCTLDHVLVVEYHGELAEGPTKPGWQVKAQNKDLKKRQLESQQQQGTSTAPTPEETGQRIDDMYEEAEARRRAGWLQGQSQLVETLRGPFHLVRDPTRARAEGAADDDILVYHPDDEDGVPVLEVIAGPPPDPTAVPPQEPEEGPSNPNDPRYHRTHISLQVKRGKFCEHEFVEKRKVPMSARLAEVQQALALQGLQVPQVPAKVTLRRHHPIVNLTSRRECALASFKFPPLTKLFRGKLGKWLDKWKYVYPPVPNVRRNAAADDDPLSLALANRDLYEEQHTAPDPNLPPPEPTSIDAQPRPGEDETTVEGWATLCTFTVCPAKQAWDYVGPLPMQLQEIFFQIDPVLPPHLVAHLPPEVRLSLIGSAYDALLGGERALVDTVNTLGTTAQSTTQWLEGARQTYNDLYKQLQLQRSGTVDPGAFSGATLAGLPITLVLHLFTFAALRPREYEVEVQTCGVPDLEHPNRGAPCDALRLRLRVYPSAEFCIRYQFKPVPEHLELGAETQTPSMHGTTGNTAQVPNPDFDPKKPESQENPRFVEAGAHRSVITVEQSVHEQRTQKPNEGPQRGTLSPDEKVGEGDSTLPTSVPGLDPLRAATFHKLERGREAVPEKTGWHGGTKPGAAPGWTPRVEQGDRHQKSRIFHPWPVEALFPAPITRQDTLQGMLLEIVQERLDVHRQDAMDVAASINHGPSPLLDEVRDAGQHVLDTLARLGQLIASLGDFDASLGFSVRFEAAFLEGHFVLYWGWKEHESRRCFPWWALNVDLVLAAVRLQFDFGARARAGFLHFEVVVYLRLALDASVTGGAQADLDAMNALALKRRDGEATWKDWAKAGTPEWLDTWMSVMGKAELGAKAVLFHENALSVGAALKTGLELRWRIAMGLADRIGVEWELYFLGVTFQVTYSILCGAKLLRQWRLMEGNPEGLPWKRGVFPGAAKRTFWNARKSVKNAWNKLIYQRRRILAALTDWQRCQLALVSASTRRNQDGTARYPYTTIAPEWFYTGDPDDEDARRTWEYNRERWNEQWEECKAAFPQEALTSARNKKVYRPFKRVRLDEVLAQRAARGEELIKDELLPRLERLNRVAEQLIALNQRIDDEEQLADEEGAPPRELVSDCMRLEQKDPDLNWRQTRSDEPITKLWRVIRALDFYGVQRVAW